MSTSPQNETDSNERPAPSKGHGGMIIAVVSFVILILLIVLNMNR